MRIHRISLVILTAMIAACSAPSEPASSPSVHIGSEVASSAVSAEPAPSADPSATPAPPVRVANDSRSKDDETSATIHLGGAGSTAPSASQAPPSTAPAGNTAKAQALFDEARQAMTAGDFGAACKKFDASLKLDFAVGTLLNLAACEEKKGDKARACATYDRAIAELHASGQPDRERFAISKRTALGCGP